MMKTIAKYYQRAKPGILKGCSEDKGPECFYEKIQCIDIDKELPEQEKGRAFAFIGFADKEKTIQGPEALRQAVGPLTAPNDIALFDAGDILYQNGDLKTAQQSLGIVVAALLRKNICPIVLGGGCESAWGSYLGQAEAAPAVDCAFVNFDAHLDMRPGSSYNQIAADRHAKNLKFDYTCLGMQPTSNTGSLLEVAEETGCTILPADAFHLGGIEYSAEIIEDVITRSDLIALSISLHVFASAFAPGVTALQPLGLFPWHVIPALRMLAASGKVATFCIAEFSPQHDERQITAKLGASLIADFLLHL